jgi:hypothetical protein
LAAPLPQGTTRAIRAGTRPIDDPPVNTATDFVLCAVVAIYLFVAMAFDLRLLVLPSLVALAGVPVMALVQGRALQQL